MATFRKKPVVIEAVQYGPYSMPTVELASFLEGVHCSIGSEGLVIETLEGNMLASVGDWIIKGVNGEFYPCKPDIFEKTYEAVEEGSESSPEQPSYKHPEKDIFNLDEATAHIVEKDVERILAEDSNETMIESDPITPMADLNPYQPDNYFDGLPNGQAQE